ncbi:T9SS type A sorting domain-containing protein [bacterium]|nr:T9SS type A sorting domain-containing protein [bacterium]
MDKTKNINRAVFIFIFLQNLTLFGQRISVSGTEFRTNGGRIWLNGTNTPWNQWNDFGGGFNTDWWDDEFQQLKDLHINCTRIWITCDGNNAGIDIDDDGFVNDVNPLFWSHVDQLMEIAQDKQIYVMIALISFNHTKPGNANASKWIKMYNSEENRQSFADNYAEPFVDRYKDNPYFFAVDVGNELEWVWENHGVPSANVIDLIFRVAEAVKYDSEVLVCQGMGAGIKYNTSVRGGVGNYLANVNVDFYNIHYYDWMNQWFGNPFDRSPSYYNMDSKPCIVGEAPAKGSAGYTAMQCYQKAFENGWQGLMVWTSNDVDDNGNKWDSKPGTDWFFNNHPDLVAGIGTVVNNDRIPDFKLFQNSPNPFNLTTTIKFTLPHESKVKIQIFNTNGNLVKTLVNDDFSSGQHSTVWNCSDHMGNTIASGTYFYQMTYGDFSETKQMLIIK